MNLGFNPRANNYQVDSSIERFTMDSEYSESTKTRRIVQTVIDFVCIIAIFVVFILIYFLLDPKIRYFTCDDSEIVYPYIDDTIAFWVVGIYGVIGPILIILRKYQSNLANFLFGFPVLTRKSLHFSRIFFQL